MSRNAAIPIHRSRRSDLDWIRVLAVLLLVPLHSANVFNHDPVIVAYVKDVAQVDFLVLMKDFLSRWRLETLFLVSGAVSWYALGRRSSGQYLAERCMRLLIPFTFGLIVLIPLTVNIHWLGQSDAPSLSDMYSLFFQKPTDLTGMDGRFTPSHLWFILYLCLFSIVALPVFQLMRRPLCQRIVAWLVSWPGTVYLFVIPLTLGRAANFFGLGDKDPLYYFLIFVFGYATVSQPRFQETLGRYLPVSLTMALVTTLAPSFMIPEDSRLGPAAQISSLWLFRLSQWTWVLTVLGAGHRWLSRDGSLLRYASEAVYPFYILHLPVATIVAYFVIQSNLGPVSKYALIVAGAMVVTIAVYELAIKRANVLRFCFGMKPLKPAGSALSSAPAHS